MIKILVVDDHAVVREGLKRIMSTTNDMAVVEEAANGDEGLQKILSGKCDVALVDIAMPGLSGLDILHELKKNNSPTPPIIILSIFSEQQYAERALRDGAYGYLTKESIPEELLSAIRAVYGGKKYISKAFAERLAFALERGVQKLPHEILSRREYSVMNMIAMGKPAREIARDLCISTNTVGTYRCRILKKMKMQTNAEMIRYVVDNKISDIFKRSQ